MRPAPSCLSPLISMVKAQRIPAGISGGGCPLQQGADLHTEHLLSPCPCVGLCPSNHPSSSGLGLLSPRPQGCPPPPRTRAGRIFLQWEHYGLGAKQTQGLKTMLTGNLALSNRQNCPETPLSY